MTSYLDYARRGETAWWRYAVTVAVALLAAVVAPSGIVLALMLLGRWPRDLLTAAQDPANPVAFFLFNGALFFVLLVAFAGAARLVQHKRFSDVRGAWTWRGFGAGFGIWCAALIVLSLVDFAIAPGAFHLSADARTPGLLLTAAVGLAAQTFAEEFIFRGYATQALLLATKRVDLTVILSGLLFGALHIPNGAPQAASAVAFGVLLALIAIRTRGIAFTYGLHLANNLFGAVVVVSGGDVFKGTPALISQNTPQLMWWDAALGAVALIAVAVLVARRTPAPQLRA